MPAIVHGARAFARQTRIAHLVADDIEVPVTAIVDLDSTQVYLAETDLIVGGLGVSVLPFLWNSALIEMSELFFWVHPGSPVTAALALLRRVLADAEAARIDLATFVSLPTSPAKMGRIYERLGFVRLQETFVKEFSWP